MEDKILKLTKLWYEYVNKDNKDCACHFYVNKVWSCGAEAYYRIEHYGYVYESNHHHKQYKAYDDAEKALYREIQKAFQKELKWAKDVTGKPSEYDNIQINRAKWLIKNYKGG